MDPVAPQAGGQPVTFAEHQPEYVTLPAEAHWDGQNTLTVLTRWTFSDEERARVAAGEDLYLGILTFGRPLQPLSLQVGPEGWGPQVEVRDGS